MTQIAFRARQVRRQRGFSILELMVSMALGLLVLAAVFVSSAGMVVASRQQRAASVMTDDALLALSLIRRDLLMAGYVHPVSINASQFSAVNSTVLSRPVYGCSTLFDDNSAAVAAGTCKPSSSTPSTSTSTKITSDAIEINFEASQGSVDLSSDNKLTGCQGSELKDDQGNVPSAAADVNTRLPTSHRYYVKDLTLSCATAGRTGQALVPNVETLQITYGVSSGWLIAQPETRRPVRYVDATQVTDWANVVAVHLCVLMRSGGPVLDKGEAATQGYTDCDGTAQTASDGYLRRAYTTTVALRNRVAP